MKITLLQQDIVWANPEENQEAAYQAIKNAPKSDVYVLPEMWSTGFATEPEGIAEKDRNSLNWMKQMAHRMDAAIAGSIATEEDGRFYNRFYFVTPDWKEVHYDKHHLFTYSGEDRHYAAGDSRVVVEWKGVRIRLTVCYDLRFPVFARNQEDYDCILYVASWPVPRIAVWRTLLQARAIENQCYVMGVNRIGSDPNCEYNGATTYVDAYGRSTESTEGEVQILDVEIDMDKLSRFRQKFPVLKDRD